MGYLLSSHALTNHGYTWVTSPLPNWNTSPFRARLEKQIPIRLGIDLVFSFFLHALTIPLKDTSWTWSTLQGCLGGHVGLLGVARGRPKGAWVHGFGPLEAGVAW